MCVDILAITCTNDIVVSDCAVVGGDSGSRRGVQVSDEGGGVPPTVGGKGVPTGRLFPLGDPSPETSPGLDPHALPFVISKPSGKSSTARGPEPQPTSAPALPGLLGLHARVRGSGVPNYRGCRVPVPTKLKIPEWRDRLHNYSDPDLCSLLEFGFPVGYEGGQLPTPSQVNHAGARQFPDAVGKYIGREVGFGATLGPFVSNPLCCPLSVSPLNTVPKDNDQRRVIVDLSFPDGASVNSGIPKGMYLDVETDLQYPTVDSLVSHILQLGRGSALFKCDLSRAYRQIRVDPGDIHLLGFSWDSQLFIDSVLPFGLRSAAHICQRVTNAVAHMFSSECAGRYKVCNYLDDFAGVCTPEEAQAAYGEFRALLHTLGLEEATAKACPPSTNMTFIGVRFDTDHLSLEVTPERLEALRCEVDRWLSLKRARKKELQSLIGKLQFAAKCVRAGRLFISRMLDALRGLKDGEWFLVSLEFKKDLLWWKRFAGQFNGVIMMGDIRWTRPDELVATDACLTGMGGTFSGGECHFFHCAVPSFLALAHIGVLELVAVVLAIKLWRVACAGTRILVQCDNMSTVSVINSGKSKDALMLAWLRELLFVCARLQIQVRAVHLEGAINRLPDCLSRWDQGNSREAFRQATEGRQFSESKVSDHLFDFEHTW